MKHEWYISTEFGGKQEDPTWDITDGDFYITDHTSTFGPSI